MGIVYPKVGTPPDPKKQNSVAPAALTGYRFLIRSVVKRPLVLIHLIQEMFLVVRAL
jgi:hypothetical protein